MITFLNKDGNPIIRQCANCNFYSPIRGADRMGYCSKLPMIFAFTGNQSVFGITRSFYVCDKQRLSNEDHLNEFAEKIDMSNNFKPKDILKADDESAQRSS